MAGRNADRGFIFVDVILGMFILVVALTAIAAVFYQSSKAGIFADDRTVAYNWAQERLEYLKSDPSWRGSAAQNVAPEQSPPDPDGNSPPRAGFTRTTNAVLANLPEGTLPQTNGAVHVPMSVINNRLIDVTVTVNWQENGQPQSIRLQTLIARN
jgi:Tfp pilus assembly protein PilV